MIGSITVLPWCLPKKKRDPPCQGASETRCADLPRCLVPRSKPEENGDLSNKNYRKCIGKWWFNGM